ncbi:hypothetical protein [Methanobrevibacter intestini]|uniref:hypothetical protein n=1 Tax=Methanobrevibacter intestini TaxID=2911853 RepID=UPI003CE78AE9
MIAVRAPYGSDITVCGICHCSGISVNPITSTMFFMSQFQSNMPSPEYSAFNMDKLHIIT